MNPVIVIPVLNPDEKTTNFVETLILAGFKNILVVNDGSSRDYEPCFDEIRAHKECTVLVHEVNKGKGAALKTAFKYLHENREDIDVAVTADGDGQHDLNSINKCLVKYAEDTNTVVFGGRDFSGKDVPTRSKFGNKLSKVVYRFSCGIKLNDTQTGLRIIPSEYFERFSTLKGDRYEYETSMILEIANKNIPYAEVPIKTIYLEENKSSHFNTIKDSVKIYVIVLKNLIKFILSSVICFIIDEGGFTLMNMLLMSTALGQSSRTWISIIVARIVSSFFNFIINRKTVFHSQGSLWKTMLKYYILAACMLCVSSLLVNLFAIEILHVDGFLETVIKCIVDLCLFFASYTIQRKWVFKEK